MSLQFDLNASPPSPVSDAVYSPDALLSSAPSSPSKPLAAQQNTLLATSSTSESSDVTGHGHVASTPYMRHLRRSSLQGGMFYTFHFILYFLTNHKPTNFMQSQNLAVSRNSKKRLLSAPALVSQAQIVPLFHKNCH